MRSGECGVRNVFSRRLAHDVQTAHQAGLPCWCVTTGTHTAEQLRAAGADAVYANLNEIAAALASPAT